MNLKRNLPFVISISISLLLFSIISVFRNWQPVFAVDTILSEYPKWYFPVSEFYPNFQSGTDLGSAVSNAGDFNNDGVDDIIFGAQKYQDEVYKEGAVFAFTGTEGSEGISTNPDWVIGSGQQGSMFGCELSALGDINNDNYDDIVVGACEYNDLIDEVTIAKAGAAFVYYGPLFSGKTTFDWKLVGDEAEARLGSALSSGNFNNDDYADLLVSAPYHDDLELAEPLTNNGRVYLFYGPLDAEDQTPDWVASGESNSAIFGSAIDNAGDVNNDGLEDIIVGAPQPGNSSNPKTGFIHIFLNDELLGFSETPDQSRTNGQLSGKFGAAVAGVGDVNKDGYDDVLVGSPSARDDMGTTVGCVYLFKGSEDGLEENYAWKKCGDQEYGQFGVSVAAAGDMDLDGYDDFLVGMPYYSDSNENMGAIFLFFGDSSSPYVLPGFESTYGNKADTEFGIAVSSAGDVNNDGKPDVIVGAPNFKVNNLRYGRTMVYYAGIAGLPDPDDIFSVFIPVVQIGN